MPASPSSLQSDLRVTQNIVRETRDLAKRRCRYLQATAFAGFFLLIAMGVFQLREPAADPFLSTQPSRAATC